MNLGSWKIDDVVTIPVNTHSSSGESDGDSVPTYRVYENITNTPILTGSLALLDDTNTTGFYAAQITLSAANGFEKGKSYTVRVRGVVAGRAAIALRYLQVEAEVNMTGVADGILLRDWTAISGTVPARSMLNALRLDRNKVVIVGTTMTVYKEDGVTTAWQATLTEVVGGNPIASVAPTT